MDKMLKNQATSATSEKDNDDDQSDKGTYTIELENPNSEEVEARKMIDKVNNCNLGMIVFLWCIWLLEITRESSWNVLMQSVVLELQDYFRELQDQQEDQNDLILFCLYSQFAWVFIGKALSI